MKRKIIAIDAEKCTGCGLCLPNCPEGALRIIDGKARLVGDLFCDGLGACLGHCPEGAITVEERDAEPYDENRVIANIAAQGANVVQAHLEHLRDHRQAAFLAQAVAYLERENLPVPAGFSSAGACAGGGSGCPGSRAQILPPAAGAPESGDARPSRLRQWPVQLHLVSPDAPYFRGADLLLAADCTAYALGDFHRDYLAGRALVIACPKLDRDQDIYRARIRALADEAKINTLTVLVMEVPCCRGLLELARRALSEAGRKVPLKAVVVGLRGDILREEWV